MHDPVEFSTQQPSQGFEYALEADLNALFILPVVDWAVVYKNRIHSFHFILRLARDWARTQPCYFFYKFIAI